jgi:hypothetical protein
MVASVSEEHTTIFYPKDGGYMFLQNIGNVLQDYMAYNSEDYNLYKNNIWYYSYVIKYFISPEKYFVSALYKDLHVME